MIASRAYPIAERYAHPNGRTHDSVAFRARVGARR
jgi:hypothetical protein